MFRVPGPLYCSIRERLQEELDTLVSALHLTIYMVLPQVQLHQNTSLHEPIQVKLSGDGASFNRYSSFFLVSFAILNLKERVLSPRGQQCRMIHFSLMHIITHWQLSGCQNHKSCWNLHFGHCWKSCYILNSWNVLKKHERRFIANIVACAVGKQKECYSVKHPPLLHIECGPRQASHFPPCNGCSNHVVQLDVQDTR